MQKQETMKKNIIILGPPCSGKGTQAKKIAEQYGLVHVSTGDIIRDEISRNTDFGKIAKNIIDAGAFVPDERMIPKLKEFLINHKDVKGYIFDGFPRNVNQAKMLDKIMFERKLRIDGIFLLNCSNVTLIQRMKSRATIEGRPDDNDNVFAERINNYNNLTNPVVSYYGKAVINIESEGTSDDVHKVMVEIIG